MTTAQDICASALEKAGVIAAGETPTGRRAEFALSEFNRMMHGLNGPPHHVAVNWTTLALTDDVPFERALEDTVAYAVANRIQTPLGEVPADRETQKRMERAEFDLAQYYRPFDTTGTEYL